MLMRGWQVMRDGKPISGLFDDRKNADAALIEFRNEASAPPNTSIGDRDDD
jgi:hypothetical protein